MLCTLWLLNSLAQTFSHFVSSNAKKKKKILIPLQLLSINLRYCYWKITDLHKKWKFKLQMHYCVVIMPKCSDAEYRWTFWNKKWLLHNVHLCMNTNTHLANNSCAELLTSRFFLRFINSVWLWLCYFHCVLVPDAHPNKKTFEFKFNEMEHFTDLRRMNSLGNWFFFIEFLK